jgi:hypothetical protein
MQSNDFDALFPTPINAQLGQMPRNTLPSVAWLDVNI